MGLTTTDASGDVKTTDAGFGGFTFFPEAPGVVFVTDVSWEDYPDVKAALAQAQLPRAERDPALPRLSMPATELFSAIACIEGALEASGLRSVTRAIIAVGDCQPAAAALNRASSGVPQMRRLVQAARLTSQQWLGVQVPREANTDADRLSHPSMVAEVIAAATLAGYRVVRSPVPAACWVHLRAAIAASSPDDDDF